MSDEQTEYQKEYDKAYAALDEGVKPAPAEEEKKAEAEVAPELKTDPAEEQKSEEVTPETSEIAELRARVEKAEKIAKDNQAWATKLAQERAAEKREREAQQREASKPAILDANPELADAIRHVVSDPTSRHQEEQQTNQYESVINKAHPGIFDEGVDPELRSKIAERWKGLGETAADPLEVVRVITEEKLAHAERVIGKRFAAESAKEKQKSAMGVPGAGSSAVSKAPIDAQLAEVQRIQNMSDAEFQKERRRVMGY